MLPSGIAVIAGPGWEAWVNSAKQSRLRYRALDRHGAEGRLALRCSIKRTALYYSQNTGTRCRLVKSCSGWPLSSTIFSLCPFDTSRL